jgi:hypothetical protein
MSSPTSEGGNQNNLLHHMSAHGTYRRFNDVRSYVGSWG